MPDLQDSLLDAQGHWKEEFLIGEMLGRVFVYCESVGTGCKPTAELKVRKRHLEVATKEIQRCGCKHIAEDLGPEYGDWIEVTIYKQPTLATVLPQLWGLMAGKIPAGVEWMAWVNGKAYGYGDTEIDSFIARGGAVSD